MNSKLIEASIGAMARMVPAEQWNKIVAELRELVVYARSADEKLTKLAALHDRVEFLENVVRNSVDGAPAIFAERDMYLHNDGEAIKAALAPAQPGMINGRGTNNG